MIEFITAAIDLETGVDYRFYFDRQPQGGEFAFDIVAKFQALTDDSIVLLKPNGLGMEVDTGRFLKAEVVPAFAF